MNKNIAKQIVTGALLALLVLGSLTSCARQISSDVYAAGAVGETSETFPGVVIHARTIMVQDKEYLEQNGLGMIGGGVGGAIAGSQIGKGAGTDLAMIGGAIAGATLGAFAEKALKEQKGMEYVVQLENGSARTVVQGPNPQLSVGQNVYVIVSKEGRSRIIAR
jgi:outer membrane lipoprotein SlyB